MSALSHEDRLAEAVSLRETGRDEEAVALLVDLQRDHPENARVNLQTAWAHDKLGLEREAVPFYERALDLGLDGEDLKNALLGLGSTYRTLGEYEKALTTLTRGVETFPGDYSLQVFRSMALYNIGQGKDACELLLRVVMETTADHDLLAYKEAIDLYASDLDRTWP